MGDNRAFPAFEQDPGKFGREGFERLADEAFGQSLMRQQRLCRGVHQRHPRIRVDRDDPGGDGFEHGFGEGAAVVDLAVGADEGLGLLFELRGHAVEGAVEEADLVRPGAPL